MESGCETEPRELSILLHNSNYCQYIDEENRVGGRMFCSELRVRTSPLCPLGCAPARTLLALKLSGVYIILFFKCILHILRIKMVVYLCDPLRNLPLWLRRWVRPNVQRTPGERVANDRLLHWSLGGVLQTDPLDECLLSCRSLYCSNMCS